MTMKTILRIVGWCLFSLLTLGFGYFFWIHALWKKRVNANDKRSPVYQTIATFIPLLHIRAVSSLWMATFQNKKGVARAIAVGGAVFHVLAMTLMLISQWCALGIIIVSFFPILLQPFAMDSIPESFVNDALYNTLVFSWVLSLLSSALITAVYALSVEWKSTKNGSHVKTSWKRRTGLLLGGILLSAPTQVLILAALGLLLKTQVEPIQVAGRGMSPTLNNGDYAVVVKNRATTRIARGEIVHFTMPNGQKRIGRVIGLPGEKIVLRSGFVWIGYDSYQSRDQFLDEDYVKDPGQTYPCPVDSRNVKEYAYLTHDGYFIMGDNRIGSDDVRCGNYPNASGLMVKREWIDGSVIKKIGAEKISPDTRIIALPAYKQLSDRDIEERMASVDQFAVIAYPSHNDDVSTLDHFTLRGFVVGSVNAMRILTSGVCGSSSIIQSLKPTDGRKEWQFLFDRRKGNLCKGKNTFTVESYLGDKPGQLVSLLTRTIESDVGLEQGQTKEILRAIEKHLLPASESLEDHDLPTIRISGNFCKNHTGEKPPFFGSPMTKIGPSLWARVIIDKNKPTLTFYSEEKGVTSMVLKQLTGYLCPSSTTFEVKAMTAERVFVTVSTDGHGEGNAAPITYIWADGIWQSGEKFLMKHTSIVEGLGAALTLHLSDNRFSLTEAPYYCEVNIPSLYPNAWSEFVFDLASMKNVGVVLHDKKKE